MKRNRNVYKMYVNKISQLQPMHERTSNVRESFNCNFFVFTSIVYDSKLLSMTRNQRYMTSIFGLLIKDRVEHAPSAVDVGSSVAVLAVGVSKSGTFFVDTSQAGTYNIEKKKMNG